MHANYFKNGDISMELFRSFAVLVTLLFIVSCGGGGDSEPKVQVPQVDTDNDGINDNVDPDDDNDGVTDALDAFPLDSNESLDTDADGIGNNADTDDDNDGVLDGDDVFPLDINETLDSDGDSIGNNADTDDDNDGVQDSADAFPLDSAESLDTDVDGIGNNADTDDDNDEVLDSDDAFPLDATETMDSDSDGTGDNADVYPQQSACHRANEGNGTECFSTWLPTRNISQIAASASGNVFFYAPTLSQIITYSDADSGYSSIDVTLEDSEHLNVIAHSDVYQRLYLGFSTGRIAYLDTQLQTISEFSTTTESVEGLATVGNYLMAQDSSGSWESHYIFDRDGNQTDWQEWNTYSSYYAWNESLDRVYFFRDRTSPNDLMYEDINQLSGLITDSGETPYHGDYSIIGPIVISPDDNHVFIGAGDIYNAATLHHEHSINITVDDAIWSLATGLIGLKQQNNSIVLTRFDDDYSAVESSQFTGTLIKAFELADSALLLIQHEGNYQFVKYVANDDVDGDLVPNSSDAFPNDPAASIDSDNDDYPDEWHSGFSAEDSTSGLILDSFPLDSACQLPEHGVSGECDVSSHVSLGSVSKVIINDDLVYSLAEDGLSVNRWSISSENLLNPILLETNSLTGLPLSIAKDSDGSLLVGYTSGSLYRYQSDGIGGGELVATMSGSIVEIFLTTNHYLVVVDENYYSQIVASVTFDGEIVAIESDISRSSDYEFVVSSQRFYWFANSYNGNISSVEINESSGLFEDRRRYSSSSNESSFLAILADESLTVTSKGVVIENIASSLTWSQLPTNVALSETSQLVEFMWLNDVAVGHYVAGTEHSIAIYSPDLKRVLANISLEDNIEFIGRSDGGLIILSSTATSSSFEFYPLEGDTDLDDLPLWWELAHGFDDNDLSDSALDSDSDGLSNLQEFQSFTDPNVGDSDGDGLTDGQEVLELGLDPLSIDSDSDAIPDGWEVENGLSGSDATDAQLDSDGDQVSNYHEYLTGTDPQDSNSASSYLLDALYSFEDSEVPTQWQLSTSPEFSSAQAFDGTVSMALNGNNTILWNDLFDDVEINFHVFSNCYSSYDKQIVIEVNGVQMSLQNVEQEQWLDINLLLSKGFHEIKVIVQSHNDNCSLSIDGITVSPIKSTFEMGANIVTQRNNILYFYDYDKTLLRSVPIPVQMESNNARDIAVLDDGRVAVFNGSSAPVLSYYTPNTNTWQHIQAPSWSTTNGEEYSGIDAIGSRVLTTNMTVAGSEQSGFVEFNLDSESVNYINGDSLIGLTVGLNGFVYATDGTNINKYNPTTLALMSTFTVSSARSIAVDENGYIYVLGWSNTLHYYDDAGTLLNSIEVGYSLYDIALGDRGELIVSDYYNTYAIDNALSSVDELSIDGAYIDFVPNVDSDNDGIPDWWEYTFGLDANDAGDAASDLDGDGLTALIEYSIGTKEHTADTDNDGLSDGEEYLTHNTNPLNTDTDNDGLTDGLEVTLTTNPLQVDTDSDGLSDTDEHLTLNTDPLVDDTDLDGMLDGYEVENNLDPLVDDASNDLDGDGLTNLEEHDVGANPNVADTDGDSLNDYDELNVHLTSPLLADTDGDSLDDAWEILFSFDANDDATAAMDSDGDLFTNLEEYFANSDPLDSLNVPLPIEWKTHQGNATHTGYTPHILDAEDFSLNWDKEFASSGVLNPVTASGDQVFVSNNVHFGNQEISALDAVTGESQWQLSYPDIHSINAPSFDQGNVYFQTGGHNDSFIRSVNSETGELNFESPYGNQWSRYLAPTIFDGDVYIAGGYYGGVYAFDGTSGAQQWFNAGPQYDNFTPSVDENYVYAFTTQLDIFDRVSGELSKTIAFPDFSWSGYSVGVATMLSPLNNVIINQNGNLVVFNTDAETILWQRVGGGYTGQPSVGNAIVYAIGNGSLYAINELSGVNEWILGNHTYQSNIIVTKTHILVGDANNTYAIDKVTQSEDWSYPAAGHLSLSADGTLYIAGEKLTSVSLK